MKPKQLIFLAIVLTILAGAVFLRGLRKPAEIAQEEFAPIDLSFDWEKVSKIQIGKGGGDEKSLTLFTMIKSDKGQWHIPDFGNARTDQEKITRLFDEIRKSKGELRAKDPALFPDFKIGEHDAYRILLFDSDWKSILSLYIGAKLGGDNLIFIRRGDANDVYLSEANLLGELGIYGDPEKEKPTMEYWAATDIVKIETDQVSKIETRRFQQGSEILTTSVVREVEPADPTKKKWRYTRPGTPFVLDAEKIKQFLLTLGSWRATKVLDAKAKDYGFANPSWQMRLRVEGSQELTLTAGAQDPETQSYYMQSSLEPVVFLLNWHYFENFDIDDSKFFADNPLSVDPEKTEKLVIQAEAKKMSLEPKAKKTDAVTSYLNDLKSLTVAKLLFDPAEQKKVKTPSRYSIEIQKEGSPPKTLDVGDIISEQTKQYAVIKRGESQPFAISEDMFKKLFENLERLSEPKA